MNKRLILKVIGVIMLVEAALMLLPMIVGLIYGESDWIYFLYVLAGTGIVGGLLLWLMKPEKSGLFVSDGFIITAGAWIVLSAVGAIPFSISGVFPSYLDSLFETVSGFTTTGVSVLPDIEALSHCMLFWRGLTNWIGGMGVLVFLLALTPVAGGASIHLYKAESPGPVSEKLTSKISTGAKYLYYLYISISAAQVIALMIAGLPFFNSVIVTFGTVATGGYTFLNTSLATLTVAQQIITEISMVICGSSFGVLFLLLTRKFRKAWINTEVKVYLLFVIIPSLLIAFSLFSHGIFGTFGESLHQSFFATISTLTTTGFVATDMNIWPWFAKGLLLFLMFVGGCSGSTAGGVKVVRVVVMLKALRNYLKELAHPRSVSEVKLNKRRINDDLIRSSLLYICLIVVITVVSMFIVSLDPAMNFIDSFSSVATTLNNNGVEFFGSSGGIIMSQWFAKIVFIIDMLIGRLEIFPILILVTSLFTPVKHAFKRLGKSHSV